MVCNEFVVDRLSSPETVFDIMPITYILFAQAPAKIDLTVAIQGREVDQAGVDVFEMATDLLDLLHRRLESPSCGGSTNTRANHPLTRDEHSAQQRDPLLDGIEFRFPRLKISFGLTQTLEESTDFGEKALGFEQTEKAWHGMQI